MNGRIFTMSLEDRLILTLQYTYECTIKQQYCRMVAGECHREHAAVFFIPFPPSAFPARSRVCVYNKIALTTVLYEQSASRNSGRSCEM